MGQVLNSFWPHIRNYGPRREWNSHVWSDRRKKLSTRLLCRVKIFFQNESKTKTFSDKTKRTCCQQTCTIRNDEVLQTERRWHLMEPHVFRNWQRASEMVNTPQYLYRHLRAWYKYISELRRYKTSFAFFFSKDFYDTCDILVICLMWVYSTYRCNVREGGMDMWL